MIITKQIVCILTLSIAAYAAPAAQQSNHLADYWKAQAIKATQVAALDESLTSRQKQMIEAVAQLEITIQAAKDSLMKDCMDQGLILGGTDGLTCVEGVHPDTPTKTK